MIKAFSAIAAAGFIAAALTVLPGFAPQVEASVPQALAKGDRLDIRTVGKDCSQQAWPNFEASCLRAAGSKSIGEGSAPGYRRPHAVGAPTLPFLSLFASRLLWFEVLGMPPGDLIDSGGRRATQALRQSEPHGNLRRLVADWHLIAPLG